MPVLAFAHYNLRADRATLDTLRDFYVQVVGLRLGARPPFNNFGYWLYAGERDVLHLSEAGPGEQRPANVTNTFDHVAFSCADMPAFEKHLDAHGVRYRHDLVPLTGQQQLFFTDPAGNGVELNFLESSR
ncbi:VOC family protein [Paraburkholderia sp. DHOC27]|uniref:VOC family protein n=1 Tax=Paraburkholderia sp. DHOC27 TaxID=2303330 RepID=UPI000E3E6027|nr:VOC family protein [Paraburkholderia sp. DHOC27]RFU48543.1 diguanylate cyclase [Paraburkholderia sp. DHOC27]